MTDRTGMAEALRQEVADRFGVPLGTVRVVVSPYRVCPLGAHVDHQLGQVTGMAIDQGVTLAFAPVAEPRVRLASRDFPGEVAFDLGQIPPAAAGDWGNYARGAALALQHQGQRLDCGMVGVTAGRLGEGGLSSSAAVGVAYLLALEAANGLAVTPHGNIALDQHIENRYLGLRNGILDQATILLSRRGQLTHIDCLDGAHRLVTAGPGMRPWSILVAFSGLRQSLVSTDYNRRVEECASAAATLLQACGRAAEPPLLGHVTAAEYAAHRHLLAGPPARRAAHFFSEVERVAQGVTAWERGDLEEFGALVTASGASSIHQYECGCPPLIELYEMLRDTPGVYGTRFSGAGFRGCCVALVAAAAAADATARVRAEYARRQPELASQAPVLVCHPDDGARVV